jgi:hypothetical protein
MDSAAIARARMRAQRLWGSPYDDPNAALRWLLAAQAQEFLYAKWSLAQRTRRQSASSVARAFDDGLVLRTHVLRPTWHFVAREDLRWLMRLSGPRVVAWTARRCAELGLDAKMLARSNVVIARAVAGEPRTRRELVPVLAEARLAPDAHRVVYMLMRAELDSIICSGPMKGLQQTYAAFDERVPAHDAIARDEALARLAERFFASRGPATVRDLGWWSGLPMAEARRGLEAARASLESFASDGRVYWLAAREAQDSRALGPRVDLVQSYDETIISYSESRDVLQTESVSFPVPRALEGFAHVILCDGRLLGHWRFARTGKNVDVQTRVEVRIKPSSREALAKAVEAVRTYLAR